MRKNIPATALILVSLVLLAGIVVYIFGTPTAGSTVEASSMQTATPQDSAAPGGPSGSRSKPSMGDIVEGEVPPPDPSSPLAIEIPGCRCHSDDPEIVAEHEQYRMNQCAGCHMGGTPAGGG